MKGRVLLIDGTSHIFRAYHRMGLHLTSPTGQNVGAVYTFCLMLKKLLKNYPKSSIIMFFDAGGQNFRHELFEDYKANREKPDIELINQIELCQQVASYYGFPVIKRRGVEADDLIGTVAAHYSKNFNVEIHSPDKDFMQLVSPSVKIVVDEKTSYKHYDEAAVVEKYNIPSKAFRDFLALKGDVSDNIPGLKGCGDKTAAKWLNQYENLENLFENSEKITGKIGEKLRAGIDLIKLSSKLVTIDINQSWPEELSKDALPCPPMPLQEELTAMFTEYGFKSLLPQLSLGADQVKSKVKFNLVDNLDGYELLREKLSKEAVVAFDLETSSLDPKSGHIIGISFCFDFHQAYYLYLDAFDAPVLEQIKKELTQVFSHNTWVAHNFKFDAKFLIHHWGHSPRRYDDTMVMAYIASGTGPFDLKSLALKHLSWDMITFERLLKKHQVKTFNEIEPTIQADYACLDAAATFRLYEHFYSTLNEQKPLKDLYENIDRPFIQSLIQMELHGVSLDTAYLKKLKEEFLKEKLSIEDEIYEQAGNSFQISSTKQLREVLFENLGLPVKIKTPKGLPSTNEEALTQLADDHDICTLLLKWRELDKLLSTYTDSLIQQVDSSSGAIHTQYHQTGTVTGRLSSSDPNLQNIPIKTQKGKLIRRAFKARQGHVLLAADYSQVELRLMAHYSQDKALLEAYANGDDIHALTASKIFDCSINDVTPSQRRDAKVVNFGLIYGMSPWGLSKQLKVSVEQAHQFHQRFFDKYPGVKSYMDQAQQGAKDQGYVTTIAGRQIPIRETSSRGGQNLRAAINGPLQGTASDLIKIAMINLMKSSAFSEIGKASIIMQVHDELVIEVPKDKVESVQVLVEKVMREALELTVPLEVQSDYGDNWQEAH